jgi:HEAT repeat protein
MGKIADTTEGTFGQALEDIEALENISRDGRAMLQWALKQLEHSDPDIRIDAIETLSECREDLAITCLIQHAETDATPDVRCAALLALGQFIYLGAISDYGMGDPQAFEEIPQEDYDRTRDFLLSVYRDKERSLDERRCAVEALSFGGGDDILDAIAELYARPEKAAKISALRAMGRSGSARWLDIVGRDLYSNDPDVQLEAIEAAGEMSADSMGKDLLRLTYSDDQDVMLSALWSLGQTGWEGAFDRLDEFTLHPDPEVREIADEAMDEWLFFNGLASDSIPEEEDEFLDID